MKTLDFYVHCLKTTISTDTKKKKRRKAHK